MTKAPQMSGLIAIVPLWPLLGPVWRCLTACHFVSRTLLRLFQAEEHSKIKFALDCNVAQMKDLARVGKDKARCLIHDFSG